MAVNDIPKPRSFPQVIGQIINSLTSRLGIRRLRKGGGILSIAEAAAQSDVKNSQDTFQLLQSRDLDNTTGIALDREGADDDAPRFKVAKAFGLVTVTDGSFEKIASKLFQGAAAPIVGSVALQVEDATAFPASGSVYVGRLTPNLEGPIAYTSKVNAGSYWTLNLSSATTRFHNRGESVVLAQGGTRVVDAGTVVKTPQGSLTSSVQFATVFQAQIPDGEVSVEDVLVLANVAGADGNVAAESITAFGGGAPFPGATVTNPLPFITGRDTELDDPYRERIRQKRNSPQRATDEAIVNAVLGIVAEDESRRCTSAELVRLRGRPSVLFIDDGSGYEEATAGVGIEVVTDSASGGEPSFRTLNRPVAKAFLQAANSAPYNLRDSARLSVRVGGVVSTHTFDAGEFTSIEAASAYEVVASINGDATISFSARTGGGGRYVVLFARSESNEDVEIVDVAAPFIDANAALLFPASRRFTALLYRNDRLLSKDGSAAIVRSRPFPLWGAFVVDQTLELKVDQTPAATYTFTAQDFIDAGTGYVTVGRNSVDAWVAVINRKVPGVTAAAEGDAVSLTSNRGRSAAAGVAVLGGTLTGNGVFTVGSAAGSDNDYGLDRATGDITLVNQAGAGDRYTLGSSWTRAFLETASMAAADLSVDASLWFAVDGAASMVGHGVGTATPLTATVDRMLPWGLRLKVTATAAGGAFNSVRAGDWMLLWDPVVAVPDALRNYHRVVEALPADGITNDLVIELRQGLAPRFAHRAVTLTPPDGSTSEVMLIGGFGHDSTGAPSTPFSHAGRAVTNHCERLVVSLADGDDAAVSILPAAKMATPRARHTATFMANGKVLVTGGIGSDGVALATTEVYDPATDTWAAGPALPSARCDHTATLMASGRVLVAGGWDGHDQATAVATAVEYNPGTNTFINASTMNTARFGHGAVKLNVGSTESNKVLVAMGRGVAGKIVTATTEIYDLVAHTWAPQSSDPDTGRAFMGLAVADDDKVVVIGDEDRAHGAGEHATWARYDVGAAVWSSDAAISQVGGTDIQFADKEIAVSDVTGLVFASCARSVTGGVAKIVHLRFNNGSNLWTLEPDHALWAGEAERVRTALTPLGNSSNMFLVSGGASTDSLRDSTTTGVAAATFAVRNPGGDNPWVAPNLGTAMVNATLDSRGLAFVRTAGGLNKVVLPAATGYTAPTWVAALNAGLEGATASVYRTSALRVSTNSFGTSGDLLLAAADSAIPQLPVGEPEANLVSHMASVVGGSGLGTPYGFQVHHLLHVEPAIGADAAATAWIPQIDWSNDPPLRVPSSGTALVGLRRWTDGLNPRNWEAAFVDTDLRTAEQGNAQGWHSEISDLTVTAGAASGYYPNVPMADRVQVGLRRAPQMQYATHQPVVFASPFALGASDDLTIVVDGDADMKRYVIPTYRKMRPTDSSFDAQVPLADLDGGNLTVNQTFGSDFRFEDFAVHMKARAKSHGADATKRILWRWFRHGAEGEFAVVRYMYADAPSATVATRIVHDQLTSAVYDTPGQIRVGVDVLLNSGAARGAAQVANTARIGLARCNPTVGGVDDAYAILGYSVVQGERTAIHGLTRLRVQVPNNGTVAQGPQDSGITAGDVLWVQMTSGSPTTLQSGSFIVDSVGAFNAGTGQQDVFVPADTLHDGTSTWTLAANPGTLSYSSTQESFWDPATVDGDLFRINGTDLPTPYTGITMRIAGHGRQYLRCRLPAGTLDSPVTTPDWQPVVLASNLLVFGGPTQTATQVAAAVTALQGPTSTTPVSATVTGSGGGVISRASWDEADVATFGYQLTDGLNHVQRTIPGGTLLTQTQFLLKDPVSADLATNADWANEDVRLVPITTQNVVDWFNAPTVSGLFTSAEVRAAGPRPQVASLTPGRAGSIEVQGGQANAATAAVFGASARISHPTDSADTQLVTVRRSEATGILGGAYVRADNAVALAKEPFWTGSTTVTAIDKQGRWDLDAPPHSINATYNNQRVEVELVGDYVALHFSSIDNSTGLVAAIEAPAFDYVYLCPATGAAVSTLPTISTANQGTFRILRSTQTPMGVTLWIENPSAIEGVSLCKVKTLAARSAVAGDVWQVMTTRFGANNRRAWTITEVGTASPGDEQYTELALRVDTAAATPDSPAAPLTFGTDAGAVQLRQGVPARQVFQVLGVTPNPDDGSFVDISLDISEGIAAVSAAAGTVLTALDKLAFPLGVWLGVDGYAYDTGLLHEACKVVYGDRDDEATYPGYAAHGADIMFSGPLVKRIQLALGLRVQSGLASDDLADRVRSAVAGVVNSTPVGKPVSIGAIVAAAQSVPGVVSAAPIKPAFTSTSDVIPVGAGQKPRVLDLRADISISFVGV